MRALVREDVPACLCVKMSIRASECAKRMPAWGCVHLGVYVTQAQ